MHNVSRGHLHSQSDLYALDERLNLCDACSHFVGVLINTEAQIIQDAGLVATDIASENFPMPEKSHSLASHNPP